MKPQPKSMDAGSIVAQPKKGRDEGSVSLPPIEKSAKRTDVDRSASLPISAVRAKRANKEFTIASYNVRTLNDTVGQEVTISHKIQQLIIGCETNNIDILAIQEHRQKGIEDLTTILHGDWTLTHTRSSHDCHGVAFLYSKRLRQYISSVVRKSDRIIVAHLQGNPKVCIISAYAPTETSSDAAKNSFYEDLSEVLISIPPHTVVVLTGDFNARLGRDSYSTNKRVIGNHCYHNSTNDNGQRLIDLCESMDLRPAHSHFKHRKSRLSTYRDPKGNFYQIDHIVISQKWWKSLRDCRAYNILDIGSDHKVVSANIKLSLRAEKKKANTRCKFMSEKLRDIKTREDFDLQLKNRFQELFDEAPSVDKKEEIQRRSDALNNALQTASEQILGKRPKKKQPSWVSTNTLQLMDAQGKAKAAYKRSQLASDKETWRQLQNQVSSAYTKDQSAHEETQLKAQELADQKHECEQKPTIANNRKANNSSCK